MTSPKTKSTPPRLTRLQERILRTFKRRSHEGRPPPTYRELCEEFGWNSTGTARDHLKALVRKGLIDAAGGKARSTQLHPDSATATLRVPLIGHVVAGQPVVAEERGEGEITIPAFLARSEHSFLLRVHGDSMEGAGILDGDLVIVRPTDRAVVGELVVVTIDSETTLKRLARNGSSWILAPENHRYQPIEIGDAELVVHGVVTGLLRSLHSSIRRAP